MRTLENCKAEVFRRSEKRIKERKKTRNRVLTCCVSLCLLLAVGGFSIRPLFHPVDESVTTDGPTRIPDRVVGGTDVTLHSNVTKYPSVTVTEGTGSAAVSKNFTNMETVGELCGFMAMYFDLSADYAIGGLDGADGTTGALAGMTVNEQIVPEMGWDTVKDELEEKYGLEEKPADYTLVFREPTGEETVFRLYENNLYNENNGCVVKLSDGQLKALTEQLEQAIGKEHGK